jgi:hypothetical protein
LNSGTYVTGPSHQSALLVGGDPRGVYPSYSLYPTTDGWLFLGALTQPFWVKLATFLGRIDLLVDERLQGNPLTFGQAALRAFVRAELERASDVVFRPPLLCTVRLSRVLVPELSRRNLDAVIDWFGISTERRHRAAGDAVATAEVLGRLLGRAAERGVGTWQELSAL